MKTICEVLEYIKCCPDYPIFVIDLFCGAGGTTTGIEQANIHREKAAKVVICINHDTNAILSHDANHQDVLHFIEDIRTVGLSPIISVFETVRRYHTKSKVLLHASLECTNFSKAKGGKPRDADSRTLAEHLFRYIEAINPDYIQIENVAEFMAWGDMDENGRPISMDKGRLYRRWVNNVKRYGYCFDHRILNAADYGAYTSRKRFFGIFAKRGLPIVWPEPTHAKEARYTLFGSLEKWKPVKEVLDFSDEGVSIFNRRKPLSEKTLERIYAGLVRFVAGGKDKFITAYYGHGDNVHSVESPSPTVTTKDRLSLVSPFFINYYTGGGQLSEVGQPCPAVTTIPKQRLVFIDQQFGQSRPAGINQPLGAITTNPKYALVNCRKWIMNTNFSNVGSCIDKPAPTITANRKWHYLMNPQFQSAGASVDKPCFTLIARMDKMPPYLVVTESGQVVIEVYENDSPMTVKIKEFMALYGIVDIKMRMLKIVELKKIMGFPEDYVLVGTQADQKKFIGNAVEVNMARVLCEALCEALCRRLNAVEFEIVNV